MSGPLVRFPTNRAGRVLVLCAYLLLFTFSCWGLWLQLTVDWDTQWSYADMFHDPGAPTTELPPELNHARNIVHATGFGVCAVFGVAGMIHQVVALRAARSRGH